MRNEKIVFCFDANEVSPSLVNDRDLQNQLTRSSYK